MATYSKTEAYSRGSSSTALALGRMGLRREGAPEGFGLATGGFSRASNSASVRRSLYQSWL